MNFGANTEELCDEIEVIVDDGMQRVAALLKINIIAVNDEKPNLVRNDPLQVRVRKK